MLDCGKPECALESRTATKTKWEQRGVAAEDSERTVAGKTIQFLQVGPARLCVWQRDCLSDQRRLQLQRVLAKLAVSPRDIGEYRRNHLAIESESGALLGRSCQKSRIKQRERYTAPYTGRSLQPRLTQASLRSTLINRTRPMEERRYKSNSVHGSSKISGV